MVSAVPGAGPDEGGRELDRSDLYRSGVPDMLDALTRSFPSVTLQDAQGNPWQPNLVHRGFTASPLQGQAQGLAAYVDGARFNQPFGDTMAFDLLPDAAIRSVRLLDANPVYGLNALGGALVIETQDGRRAPGGDARLATGDHGEREAAIAMGGISGPISYFGAFQARRDGGWRDFSPSQLDNFYADVGHDGASGGVHLKVLGADTDLTGNGAAPVELLAARRRSVFTWPDNTRSRFGRISLHPWIGLGQGLRVEAALYGQKLHSLSVNGDAADIASCVDQPALLCLGNDDEQDAGGQEVLVDSQGVAVAAPATSIDHGVLNRGDLHTRAGGLMVQLIHQGAFGAGMHRLVVGASLDGSRSSFATETELGALADDRSVAGLGLLIDQPDGAIAPVSLQSHTRFLGLFLAETLPLATSLTLDFGLRYNHARIELDDRIGTALDGRHGFSRLNPGLELSWQATRRLAVRLGYAETNRAPTPAELSCADETAPCSLANFFVADPPLRQVVARTLELGASGSLAIGGWQMDWNAAAFRADSADDIQHVASSVRGRAYFRNIGNARRQGGELTVRGSHGGWQIGAGYAFTDATYRSALALSSPANPQADEDGVIRILAGDRMPGVPRHSLTVSLDHAGSLKGRAFTFGADLHARSGQVPAGGSVALGQMVRGYAVAHARASLALSRRVSLFGRVRNLFDAHHETFGTFSEVNEIFLAEAPGASDPRAFGPGAPRRWTVGLAVQW